MTLASFPQPLYARTYEDAKQVMVLAIFVDSDDVTRLFVVHNDPEESQRGVGFWTPYKSVRFEHFYWPEIEPVDSEVQHPQDPAGMAW